MKRHTVSIPLVVVAMATVLVAWARPQGPTRVYSVAVATVAPGDTGEYLEILEQRIMPFLEEQGAEVIGVFRNGIGGPSNEIKILVAYRDMAHVQAIAENSTLTAIQEQTFDAMRTLTTSILFPVSFSPLQ